MGIESVVSIVIYIYIYTRRADVRRANVEKVLATPERFLPGIDPKAATLASPMFTLTAAIVLPWPRSL
jgi:hypothetical protein